MIYPPVIDMSIHYESPPSVNVDVKNDDAEESVYNINQQLVLYIPYVYEEQADSDYFSTVFRTLDIGEVKHVEFQEIIGGYQAYVFMEYWHNNIAVDHLQDRILNDDQEARLVHDDPYYWVLLPSTGVNPTNDYMTEIAELKETNNLLSDKLNTMESKMSEAEWWINKHDSSITNLTSEVAAAAITLVNISTTQTDTTSKNMPILFGSNPVVQITKSKSKSKPHGHYGCGAVSDAWEPSQPSESKNVWVRRLRPRT